MSDGVADVSGGGADIGIIGLGVMGQNLARNIARNGFSVAVYNRTTEKMTAFMKEFGDEGAFTGAETVDELVAALARPRRVISMVKAGGATDAVLDEVSAHFGDGDIFLDGGNAHFADTIRRGEAAAERGVHYLGVGISGGEEGALHGPSIMPGGPKEAYEAVGPILETIAAAVDGVPCCTWLGPDAAGHYVKMVHNGIEYADMQLIAETYDLLRHVAGLDTDQIADVFAEWNSGELESFLVEITTTVLRQRDAATGEPLVDVILDEAAQKGTGSWTAQDALALGTPSTAITAAVFARVVSLVQAGARAGVGAVVGAAAVGRRPRRPGRGSAAGAVRGEGRRLRAGLRAARGGGARARMGPRPRRRGDHLARRVHHPGALPRPHQGGVRRAP